jgi:peroxiredoxin
MKKFPPFLIAIACCAALPLALLLFSLVASKGRTPATIRNAPPSNSVAADVGDKAPSFSFVSTDGVAVNSGDLRGKVVVLTSAAAWCTSCKLEAGQFAAVYAQNKGGPIEFITIDIDPRDDVDSINAFRKENATPWPYGDERSASQLIDDYRFNRFEITYVIDKGGVIRHKDSFITNSDELEKAIKPWL